MGLRRLGREIVLQTLYSLEFIEQSPETEHKDFLPFYLSKFENVVSDLKVEKDDNTYNFALDILQHIVLNLEEIDATIEKYSENWSLDNMAQVDKAILRIGVYELNYTEIAPPIAINEAIEISKKFCSESSGKFINGILNAVSKGMDNGKTDL